MKPGWLIVDIRYGIQGEHLHIEGPMELNHGGVSIIFRAVMNELDRNETYRKLIYGTEAETRT